MEKKVVIEINIKIPEEVSKISDEEQREEKPVKPERCKCFGSGGCVLDYC